MHSLYDLNVLIAILDAQHVHNERAHEWHSQHRAEGWVTCPLTQNGFVRVVSQPSYRFPISIRDAFDHLHRSTETDDHTFWPDDISLLDEEIIDRDHVLGPKQLTDLYLLALAVKHGGRLVTFDRSISLAAVRGAHARYLAVI